MRLLFSFLFLATFLAMPITVSAQDSPEGETISLRPATVSISVPAGEVTLQTLYFTNSTGNKRTFTSYRADYDFVSKDEKGIQFFDAGITRDSVHGMLDVTPINFELEDGETQELLVRIRPFETTAPGQYKGALFIGEQTSSSHDASIQVAGRVGSIIGVIVTQGTGSSGGALDPASAKPSFIFFAFITILILSFFGAGIAALRSRPKSIRSH